MHTHIYTYIHMYIYIYIERERCLHALLAALWNVSFQ